MDEIKILLIITYLSNKKSNLVKWLCAELQEAKVQFIICDRQCLQLQGKNSKCKCDEQFDLILEMCVCK